MKVHYIKLKNGFTLGVISMLLSLFYYSLLISIPGISTTVTINNVYILILFINSICGTIGLGQSLKAIVVEYTFKTFMGILLNLITILMFSTLVISWLIINIGAYILKIAT